VDKPRRKCDKPEKCDSSVRKRPHLSPLTKQDNPLIDQMASNVDAVHLKAIFESSADCILVWDKHYNYLYANQAAIDHVKTTRDKVIGKNIRDGLGHVPDFMHVWMSRIDQVFNTGEGLCVEDTMPVGERLVHSQSVLSPIRYPDGRMFAVGVVYRDITEQKRMEAALRESELRFMQIFQNAGEGILVVDIETRKFVYANPGICQMLGYTCQELLQLGVPDIHPKEVLDDVTAAFEIIVDGGKTLYELPCMRKDRSILLARISGAPIDIAGKKQAYGFFSDITEHKTLQHKLVDNEKLYRELYDRARIPLFRTRIHDGKLLECNEAMVKFLGYTSKDECLNEHYSTKQYANPARRAEILELLVKDGFVNGFEIEFVRRDGTRAWVEVSAKIYHQEGYVEGAQIDITATKVLTRTEQDTLRFILHGKSNKEIARILSRSIRTIEGHRANIMQKLNAKSLAELLQKTQFFIPEPER
jgi:PAS domain S-box-containing protein